MFKDYVSKFLKIKQEASGFPDWVLKPYKDDEGEINWTQQDAEKPELQQMKDKEVEKITRTIEQAEESLDRLSI